MRDHEAWLELLHRMGGALTEMVPPEAQTHLLNAQRELLTALVIIYEHRTRTLKPDVRPDGRSSRHPSARGHRRIPVD